MYPGPPDNTSTYNTPTLQKHLQISSNVTFLYYDFGEYVESFVIVP